MTTPIRSIEIERAVKAVLRAGATVTRVEVDTARGVLIVHTGGQEPPVKSFDSLDFRREAR